MKCVGINRARGVRTRETVGGFQFYVFPAVCPWLHYFTPFNLILDSLIK